MERETAIYWVQPMVGTMEVLMEIDWVLQMDLRKVLKTALLKVLKTALPKALKTALQMERVERWVLMEQHSVSVCSQLQEGVSVSEPMEQHSAPVCSELH
jgi:hypothetical protein